MIIKDLHYLEDVSSRSQLCNGGFDSRVTKILVRQLALASTKVFVVGVDATAKATAIDQFFLNGIEI